MSKRKTVLLISPQASRIGHGAFHGQRTLVAFRDAGKWDTILLTGKGFRNLVEGQERPGLVIETDHDLEQSGNYRGPVQAVKWGLKRRAQQDRFFAAVDRILTTEAPEAVFFLDGDVAAIHRCWKRNARTHPGTAWVVAHNTIDFRVSDWSIRSVYKALVASKVGQMTERMGATVLYTGDILKEEYATRLNISESAKQRIILAHFGCDAQDKRLSKADCRTRLGIPVDAKVALFFGMIRSDKRPDIAIRAVSEAGKHWWLLMAGKPYSYSRETLNNWIHSYGIQHRSELIPRYLTEGEIGTVFSAADVLLLTHDRPEVSNSGLLGQARSFRLPVLASDVGYLGESVREDRIGFLAVKDDPISFAKGLTQFNEMDTSSKQMLVDRISTAAGKYSFAATVENYTRALGIAMAFATDSASNND